MEPEQRFPSRNICIPPSRTLIKNIGMASLWSAPCPTTYIRRPKVSRLRSSPRFEKLPRVTRALRIARSSSSGPVSDYRTSSVFYPNEPQERVPATPPSSPLKSFLLTTKSPRCGKNSQEYRAWGVPHVWLVDPHSKRMYTCDAGLIEVSHV